MAADPDLAASYDVILFAPVGFGDPMIIVQGLPMWGDPLPLVWNAILQHGSRTPGHTSP